MNNQTPKSFWFTEDQTKGARLSLEISASVAKKRSHYQTIEILDSTGFGRVMVIDDVVMLTERDEFVYHEMLAHISTISSLNPRSVLVVGGGDGGVIRELVKYRSFEQIDLVEIDGDVVELSKKYLPFTTSGYADPRVKIYIEDGIKFVKRTKGLYDLIVVDSTDPVGPAIGLFGKPFYKGVFAALNENGIMVAQTESPFYYAPKMKEIYRSLKSIFPIVHPYYSVIPTYPGALFSMAFASKNFSYSQNLSGNARLIPSLSARYYNRQIHTAAFALPNVFNFLM